MCHEKLKEAFLQGREREAAVLFRQMMKGVVRLGLFGAMKEDVYSLCGRRYQPDPHSDYQRADADRLFKSLREAQGKEAGEETFDDLLEFVSERNVAAAVALEERRAALLALHHLDVPSTLNTTFLSTNLIENVFRNWRAQSGNVKRWNEKQDMVFRWMASGLLWQALARKKK